MSAIQSGKGFVDLFPPHSDIFTFLEDRARSVFTRWGCRELRTPIVEFTELFVRGIGDETDVVQKEMYTFPDRKGRSMTLRPEATAGVLRACIQHRLFSNEALCKYFTIGPMFRYERPQKGRQRQFHQVNVEVLGSRSPLADVDVLFMLHAFLTEIGLLGLVYELNSLGCPSCRPGFRLALEAYYGSLPAEELCADCRRRMHTNPMRVLDCKVPSCREATKDAPSMAQHTCAECRGHFEQVLSMLADSGIQTRINPLLVRGLDYYQGTTFEVVSTDIGSQSSVAGGGRYDGLVSQLGGPEVPGIGFACGLERLSMLVPEPQTPSQDAFIAVQSEDLLPRAATLARDLRTAGLSVEFPYDFKSLKSQFRAANRLNARACVILEVQGDDALGISLKDMRSGEQSACTHRQLPERLRALLSS